VEVGNVNDAMLAPWWRRVVAYLLDVGLLIGTTELAFLAIEGYSYLGEHRSGHQQLIWSVIVSAVAVLYYATVLPLTNGRTVGMLALGIRIVRTDQKRMTATRALWRQVVLLLLVPAIGDAFGGTVNKLFLLAFSLDYLWPLWDRENRAIHDMLAGTRVRFANAPHVAGERAPVPQSSRSG
jgi:uncharacterized RDD family membrane protein YckC